MEWIKIFDSRNALHQALAINQPRLVLLGKKRICLVRQENDVCAVADTCTHNGESLSKGSVNYLGEVICPWHGHRFNLKTGRECEERSKDLITYPIKENEEGIFIGI